MRKNKNKLLVLLCAFLVSIGLWLYVVSYVSVGDDISLNNVPVSLMNQDDLSEKELMLLPLQDSTIDLQLFGNRADLWKLTRDNVSITVDLSTIAEAGTYNLRYTVVFPDAVDNVTVRGGSPERLPVEVVEYAENSVPVVVTYTGELAEGLLLDRENAQLDFESVLVSGPKDVVEKIAAASISVDRTGLTETLDYSSRYTLVDENGDPVDSQLITTNTAEIHLYLPVEHIKEIPLKVDLIPGGGAGEKDTTVNIEPKSIILSGSEAALEKIDEIVLGTIDLATVKGNVTTPYPIQIPDGLRNQSGVTQAEVSIKFQGLSKKTFTIDTFQAANLPEGLEPTIITKQVEITLRGPSAEIANLTAADIVVTADYKNQDAGTVTVPLTISVKGNANIGALEKYNITVTLAPPESTEPTT